MTTHHSFCAQGTTFIALAAHSVTKITLWRAVSVVNLLEECVMKWILKLPSTHYKVGSTWGAKSWRINTRNLKWAWINARYNTIETSTYLIYNNFRYHILLAFLNNIKKSYVLVSWDKCIRTYSCKEILCRNRHVSCR